MKIFSLDIPDNTKRLYNSRLNLIRKKDLFFLFGDELEYQRNCDYHSFGRVLYIRKFKTYAIVKLLANGNKETLILKGDIQKSFLKYIRRNDYIYVVGSQKENRDINVHFFKVVSTSISLQNKGQKFLHERLANDDENRNKLKLYSKVYTDIDRFLKRAGYLEVKSRTLQNSFYTVLFFKILLLLKE